ncbi:hypothetical protein QO034_21025 [Sedimentitalea sp. JM2-8]|uniref:Uncharacterized protein n=1 Tax=Sedimentitalea xiamensis TaxID=3050037 RepID=A0ABT7FKL2_9RHOB|nr:hypothetical protein [Sedimentitalea xiamensis]MDK3075555.1 hypothetical protein [Sedimentitalea xiamensis]
MRDEPSSLVGDLVPPQPIEELDKLTAENPKDTLGELRQFGASTFDKTRIAAIAWKIWAKSRR